MGPTSWRAGADALQQSLAQFQSSQRIRELEDQIIAIGEEIEQIRRAA